MKMCLKHVDHRNVVGKTGWRCPAIWGVMSSKLHLSQGSEVMVIMEAEREHGIGEPGLTRQAIR